MLKSALPFFERMYSVAKFAGPSMLDQTIVSGLNFLVGIYLAYALGLDSFGQFSLILVITFFCLEMQRAFVLAPMMTFAAKQSRDGYIPSVLLIMNVVAIAMGVFSFVFIKISGVYFPMWGIWTLALPSVLLVISRSAQEFLRRFLFIYDKPYQALWIDILVSVIVVAGIVAMKITGYLDVHNVLLLHGLAYTVGYVVGFAALRTQKIWPSKETLLINVKKHWIFGRWLVAGVVATYASSNLLLLTGAAQLGSQAAGIIKTAQYLMGGMIVLFQAMENIIPYRMAQLTSKAPQDVKRFLMRTLIGMLAFCFVHGLFIYFFIDPISTLVAPGREAEMRPIAIANIFFTALLVVTYCLQYLLRALERTKPIFWANAVTAVFSLVFGSCIITTYGVIGITYGLFVIQLIVQAICIFAVRDFWWVKK